MSEAPEPGSHSTIQETTETNAAGSIPALSWALFILALIAGLFAWDFSEIIFAQQHRKAALELVQPGMRLMKAERDLNQQHYVTLYITKPGLPPSLDVSTCRRLPWTFQLIRKLFPRWRAPERVADSLLAATHFRIIADQGGVIRADTDGGPLIEI